jgi:hypothetical protein
MKETVDATDEFGYFPKHINATKAALKHVKCRVRKQNHLSEYLNTLRDLIREDSLSCTRFCN